MQQLWGSFGSLTVTVLAAMAGLVVAEVGYRVLRTAARRMPPGQTSGRVLAGAMLRRAHRPAQLLVALVAARFAVLATTDDGTWRAALLHALLIVIIVGAGWLVASMLMAVADTVQSRFRIDVPDNQEARRAYTQMIILRRLGVAAVTVLAIGVALTTFDAVRAFGATLIASAGLAGVIAGLAAQTTLGNVFAGLQLAFGDALRIDDVVVVEGEWGRIEEITLSYVVVSIWDQRRMILPSSYFTTTPFTSWTRREAQILGTVDLDVDWSVPVPQLRAELERLVREHPLWDARAVALQVTKVSGPLVTVRALVSAADGPRVWDLRCAVREHLVEWVRTHHPHALPRMRAEISARLIEERP